MDLTDFEDDDDIFEIPKSEWPNHNILDTEAPKDENGEYPIIETFEQYMTHAHKYEIIATTNY